jgi:orotidine-5'-phosphate decarboxylase
MPFVRVATREHKGVFVLVRTSNASAGEFQDLVAEGRPLYRHVADRLRQWAAPHVAESGYSLVGAVVGATCPGQLSELRSELPGILMLVPGYGSQGATSRDVAGAFEDDGLGALINNSRGITGAHARPVYRERFGERWQSAVEQAVRDMIDDLAANTSAGRLRVVGSAQEIGAAMA